MKLFITLLVCLTLVGCTSKTEFGECIGVNDKGNPKLEYKYSTWNILLGVIFFEMIVPPVIVIVNELQCPVGNK